MRRKAKRGAVESRPPKTKPELPDLNHSKNALVNSLRSPELKRGYRYAIVEFIEWYCSEARLSFSKVVVTRLTYEAIEITESRHSTNCLR
jgi:hypothetical protein